jgi:hypothetical protein
MTERSGHSKSCEGAEKPPCACQCGGAEHGWQRALAIASRPPNGDLARLGREADQAWRRVVPDRVGQRKPGPQTAGGREAAIKSFIVEVIRWLQRDPALREDTEDLGQPFRISRDINPDEQIVEARVIPELREKFGDQRIKDFQKKAGNAHFWCELLAQTAHALDKFRGHYDRAKREVVAALTSNSEQRPDGWASLLPSYQDVIKKAVELIFKHLPSIATGGISVEGGLRLIWPARVLAVLMCREPRRHRAVREYCVEPIMNKGAARIKEEVKHRLRRAWPGLFASNEGAPSDLA